MKQSPRSAALLVVVLLVSLLLGVGSCAARVPVTVSADSPTNEPSEPNAANDPDDSSECGLQFAGGVGEAGAAQTSQYDFCDSPKGSDPAPKRRHSLH